MPTHRPVPEFVFMHLFWIQLHKITVLKNYLYYINSKNLFWILKE